MNDFDRLFDALYRNTIGFDPLLNKYGSVRTGTFPPHDVIQDGEHTYRLQLALAGYGPEDVEVVQEGSVLTVKSAVQLKSVPTDEESEVEPTERYLHKGIAKRSFNLRFALGEHMEVKGGDFSNGLLTVHLERIVPERLQPRKIEIASAPMLEHKSDKPRGEAAQFEHAPHS